MGSDVPPAKKICLTCNEEFAADVVSCPHDKTPLTPLLEHDLTGVVLDGRYEILSEIGDGGMGRVYVGKHLLMKRQVAIKVLHQHLVTSTASLKRFKSEAEAVSLLNHPNIVTVFDFGVTANGQPYLVMDYLTGRSLATLIEEEGRLTPERIVNIAVQACKGLSHAHQKGLIHRDVKPSNMMLVHLDDSDEFVKLLDFGIAKRVSGSDDRFTQLTATGDVFGSPHYMSPEQCRGRPLDARTDIYALGCVVFAGLTGRPPFDGCDFMDIMLKQVGDPVPAMRDIVGDDTIPQTLEDAVRKALSKDAGERFSSMAEFRDALLAALQLDSVTIRAAAEEQAATSHGSDTGTASRLERPTPVMADAQTGRAATAAVDRAATAAGHVVNPAPAPAPVAADTVSGSTAKTPTAPSWQKLAPYIGGLAILIFGLAGFWQAQNHHPGSSSSSPGPVSTSAGSTQGNSQLDDVLQKAQAAYNDGELTDASKLAQQAVDLATANGITGSKRANGWQLLGMSAFEEGDYSKAEFYLNRAMAEAASKTNPDQGMKGQIEVGLGRVYSALQDYTKALASLQQGSADVQAAYGDKDMHFADVQGALGEFYLRQGDLDKAIVHLNRSLQIKRAAVGDDSEPAADTYNDLGQAYQIKGDLGQAETYYKKSLAIRRAKLGSDNPYVSETLYCLGTLETKRKKWKESYAYLAEALKIQTKELGPNSGVTKITAKLYAAVKHKLSGGKGMIVEIH